MKIAIVTGAGSGMGKDFARRLDAEILMKFGLLQGMMMGLKTWQNQSKQKQESLRLICQ